MSSHARISAAITGAALAPLVALAQGAPPDQAPSPRTYGWLWLAAAALVVVALFRAFFGRPGRSTPPRNP
jgi:hypothetical protein